MFRLDNRSYKEKVVLTRVRVLVLKAGFVTKSTVHSSSDVSLSDSLLMCSAMSWSRSSVSLGVRSMMVWHDRPMSHRSYPGSCGRIRREYDSCISLYPLQTRVTQPTILAAPNEVARRGKLSHVPWHDGGTAISKVCLHLRENLTFQRGFSRAGPRLCDVLLTVDLITRCEPKL